MLATVISVPDQRVSSSGKFLRLGGEKFFIRGVTYGPFSPGDGGVTSPTHATLESDLQRIASLGFNVIRVYDVPTPQFLEACAAAGLRLLVGVPWAQHVDFFSERDVQTSAREAVRKAARRCRDSTSVLGYLVANEIESTLVRWMGPARVNGFIDELIDVARSEDDVALIGYANYPSTEYLRPRHADFVAVNVYLENEDSFRRYLGRLQNLAGDKPLVITEFGLDARSEGDARQAEVMDWHWREVLDAGLAGSVWFSYTDEWHRGNQDVTDWHFGIVTRERKERPCGDAARAWLEPGGRAERWPDLTGAPRVSVIVCTYNGHRTLRHCLQSLERLNYPEYELIVIDDGSGPEVREIAEAFSTVRYLRQEHAGLSVARNRGAREATGELFVYTDDDCVADEDWLRYLVACLKQDDFAAGGGPNIPPDDASFVEACVAAAPGSPSHVLLSDSEAEHVPGCNLAVWRSVFEELGGFRPEYVAAGDDVDFCWRLQEAGYRIGFSPAAMVWHHRRAQVSDYFRQQRGYGKAEALLMRSHPERFGVVGAAHWRGVIYPPGGGVPVFMEETPRIYQGRFGHAPFQRIYGGDEPPLGHLVSSVHWIAGGFLLMLLGGFFSWWLLAAGAAMMLANLLQAVRLGMRVQIASPHDHLFGRLLVIVLTWWQPLVRGWARYFGGIGYRRRTRSFLDFPKGVPRLKRDHSPVAIGDRYWNEQGRTRDEFFGPLAEAVGGAGWECVPGYGWESWDLEASRSLRLWSALISTVTEYHDGSHRLTRIRFRAVPTTLAGLGHTVVLAAALSTVIIGGRELVPAAIGAYAAVLLLSLASAFTTLSGLRRVARRVAVEIGLEER